jgi:hypothetical protein
VSTGRFGQKSWSREKETREEEGTKEIKREVSVACPYKHSFAK